MSHVGYRAADPMERRVQSLTESQRFTPPVTGTVVPIAGSTIEVVSVRLDAELAAMGELAQCLSDGERLRASRFVFERHRRRFIVGRARLRHLLASRLGVQPDAVELVYGPRGKPRLSRSFADADLCFNVSHSEDVAVYVFSSGREIGVDVEAVSELRDADEIAARFFSRRENQAYLALDPCDRPLGFFNCWTRKEAFIKALGDGLYYPLDCFDVSLAPGEPARILRVADVAGSACGWTLYDLDLEPGFVGAVVVGDQVTFRARRP
jgi:4'-phosphopantetheinyl transferase